MLKHSTAESVAHGIQELASLPALHAKLLNLLSDPGTSLIDLAPLINTDTSLAARLLRVSNSSFYGRSGRITTVVDALKMLGVIQVRSIVVSTGILAAFDKLPQDLLNMKAFWFHSALTGFIAKDLAILLHMPHPDEAHTAGLLHDIGRLAIVVLEPVEYHKLLLFARSSGAWLTRLENQHLGFTHCRVGAILLQSWGLPLDLVQVAEYHHAPRIHGNKNRLVWLVHLADAMAHALEVGNSGEPRVPPFEGEAWSELNLPGDELNTVLTNAETNATEFLEVLVNDS